MVAESGNNVLSLSFNTTKKSVRMNRAHDLLNTMLSNIAAIDFDEIAVTENATTDVFVLKKASVLVSTATVTYTDATKETASGIVLV